MARQKGKNKYVKRQDGLFSKKIVRQVLFVVNLFTITILFVSFKTGGIGLDTLITNWFSFFKTEVLALAGIRVSKETLEVVRLIRGDKDEPCDFG
ncbi:hypothetical protein ABID14_000332 [Peptoniphilus olsenii]|uniref:Uncharacterized protein n=1 Tax=Peptoniphilus olsenii TaxID=411570 RepID=A0ABV2J7F6_9FIRM